MAISENAEKFYKLSVVDFTGEADWDGPKKAYRLRVDWESKPDALQERLQSLVQHSDAGKLTALVIGMWGGESDHSSAEIVKALVKAKDRLAGLRAIFLGDIAFEENEISWIQQSDVSPLLKAFPQLEVLRVRGGNGLQFSKVDHPVLRELIVESGGLPRSVVREIVRCDFPNLEHLELWLGTDNYGWDGGPQDLQPILSGKLYPQLKYLGFRDSEIVDDIAPVVVNSPILKRLEILDLSMGNMTDSGGNALLSMPKDCGLKKLELSHHYMTPEMVKRLKKELPCKVTADDAKEPEDEWRSVAVSE